MCLEGSGGFIVDNFRFSICNYQEMRTLSRDAGVSGLNKENPQNKRGSKAKDLGIRFWRLCEANKSGTQHRGRDTGRGYTLREYSPLGPGGPPCLPLFGLSMEVTTSGHHGRCHDPPGP